MLEVSLLGVGAVLRLEKSAGSMVKCLWQTTNEYPRPLPPCLPRLVIFLKSSRCSPRFNGSCPQTGNLFHTYRGHSTEIVCLSFDPHGTKIATGSMDNTARWVKPASFNNNNNNNNNTNNNNNNNSNNNNNNNNVAPYSLNTIDVPVFNKLGCCVQCSDSQPRTSYPPSGDGLLRKAPRGAGIACEFFCKRSAASSNVVRAGRP